MPRGHAKTTLFVARAARLVGVTRGLARFGILTAVDGDAERRAEAVRMLVESDVFAEVFPWAREGVRGDPWTDGRWSIRGAEPTLGKDATMTTMGLRSVRAGARLDYLLADDMVGLQENRTAGQRELVRQTYYRVVDPMVVPWSVALGKPGQRWFLGTRWHEDDIYATLIKSSWPYLLRKAIQDDGTALWPSYWPLEKLVEKRSGETGIGSAYFDLQYQNDPTGMGGNIFKRDWFKYVDHVPAGARRVGVDLAITANQRSDYTAAVEVLEDNDRNIYIVGAWHERLEEGHRQWLTGVDDTGAPIHSGPPFSGPRLLWPLNLLPSGFAGLTESYPAPRQLSALNIESTVFQVTFTREILRMTRLPAKAVYPGTDKVTRARALAIRYEAGKVYHLRTAPGLRDLEAELIGFPNAQHDDLVDAEVYAADVGGNDFSYGSVRF